MKQIMVVLSCVVMTWMYSVVHAAVQIVTTTQDLAAIAEEIGGGQVSVDNLTPGTRDPHFAVARPSMIRKVSRADLLLVVGADMEIGWLPPLLQASRNAGVQPGSSGYLDLSTSVPLLGKPTGAITRAMGDVHARGNPHYWLDPRNGVRIARAITARLSELDAGHVVEYQQRLESFIERMDQKLPQWRAALASLRDQPVIAYHKSFVYLADVFGFVIVDEVEPLPGIAPSAASLSSLVARISNEKIRLLIMEPYYERRSARYLNEQTGLRVAVLPQSVGAEPGIETYFDLFDAIVTVLNGAQGNSAQGDSTQGD